MAGRPLRTAMVLELTKLTREYFDIEPEKTILDYACAWLEDGESLTSLAAKISESTGAEITRGYLSRYIHNTYEDAVHRLPEARREGAGSLVEGTTAIADSVEETREAIAKAKLRIDNRLFRAAHADRAQFGEQKAPTISISISGLHLDALRARPVLEATLVPALPAPAELIEAEVDEGP